MQLSLSTCSLSPYFDRGLGMAAALDAIKRCGFTCIDYEIHPQHFQADALGMGKSLDELLKERGMCAYQAHGPSIHRPQMNQPEVVEMYEKTFLFCRNAGIARVVIHPLASQDGTRKSFMEDNTVFFRRLLPIASDYGITVLVENIGNYSDPFFLWNGKDLRELIDRIAHPNCSACWDVGHANHYHPQDCDQYQSIVDLGDRLEAVHVHDNCGYFEDTHRHYRIDMHTMPFVSLYTSVNYDAVLQGLKDSHFQGTFNFEVIAPAQTKRNPFIYRGHEVDKLALLPLELWVKMNQVLYEIGAHMLSEYGL